MIVFLWTDLLLWGLIFSLVILCYKLKDREDFKAALTQIINSKIGVITGTILCAYILIGLLDSIHYKNLINHDITSILDYILRPWSVVNEKTFSSPFANHMFVKSSQVLQDGKVIMTYEKLKYVNHRMSLINSSILISASIIISWLFVFLVEKIIKIFFKQLQLLNLYNNIFPKKTFFGFLFSMIFVLSILYYLYKFYHILGTDKIGRDVLYISIKSIRTGLIIGSLTTLFMAPFGIIFGTMAGYYGGRVDDIIQYVYITLTSIPSVLLIAACVLIAQVQLDNNQQWFTNPLYQADLRLLLLCIILGITSWSGLCRLIRAETMKIKELDYVTAAKTMKVSTSSIIKNHIIPNLSHIIIINIAIDFSSLVLAEAVLSYIGVGVDHRTMSWGNMINAARNELAREPVVWWTVIAAFIPMFTFVISLNLFADKLRDAFDARIRLQ